MSSHTQLFTQTPAQALVPKHLEDLIRSIKVLIVDDDYHMRKVVRTMLIAIGVREIYDAGDAVSGLRTICSMNPDVVILDWGMPEVGGADFLRAVRAPGSFPAPNIPVIVLTGHGERSCVVEAMQFGANEYLLKPVSTKALFDRLVSVLAKPRPMVKSGDYYGPEPRPGAAGANRAEAEAIYAEVTGGDPQASEQHDQHKDKVREDEDDVIFI
jgi:DNA-binding response OmpR family regulator